MIRIVVAAVTALAGAVTIGRKVADKSVEKRLETEIDLAKASALVELDQSMEDIVKKRLAAMATSLLAKAGLIAIPFLAYAGALISPEMFKISAFALIAGFVGYDAATNWPELSRAVRFLRQYRLNAKRALREYVAETAFERAYAQAMKQLRGGRASPVIAVSSYSMHGISEEVAKAVSQLAAEVSYERAKPRAIFAAMRAGAMLALYAAFIALVVWAQAPLTEAAS